jgi:hypothetical protein
VFSLQSTPDVSRPDQPTPPAPRKIKELNRPTSSQTFTTSSAPVSRSDTPDIPALPQSNAPSTFDSLPVQSAPTSVPGTPNPAAFQLSKATVPRHFHISRSSTPSLLGKRKAEPTVFIERRSRPKSREGESLGCSGSGTPTQRTDPEPSRPQKKPGLAARSSTPPIRAPVPKPGVAPLRNVRLPSGDIIPWDVSSERLAAEMQAYTLQEIGKNLAASQTPRREPQHISSYLHKTTPSKFKPKAPAQRYAQRHREDKSLERKEIAMDLDGPYEDEADDDSEYIIDTYIRMPADALETEGMPKKVGFLVLDSQPDIDEFYREDEESDEEEDDIDEDENGNSSVMKQLIQLTIHPAENHYTADYPDEEVDSDDEFGRNAYNYRTHNASDLEEFDGADEDDMTFSDDENESMKYPWMKTQPKNGFIGL